MNLQQHKLDTWSRREFQRLSHHIIVKDANTLVVFGRYMLDSGPQGCTVSTWSDTVAVFSNTRTALSWCVADKFSRYQLANSIKILDEKKQSLIGDIQHNRLQTRRSQHTDFCDLLETKIQHKQIRLENTKSELEKCINLAKYLQLRGFDNETARTSTAQSHTDNRTSF